MTRAIVIGSTLLSLLAIAAAGAVFSMPPTVAPLIEPPVGR